MTITTVSQAAHNHLLAREACKQANDNLKRSEELLAFLSSQHFIGDVIPGRRSNSGTANTFKITRIGAGTSQTPTGELRVHLAYHGVEIKRNGQPGTIESYFYDNIEGLV